jgi:spore maturation protein CgeB
MRIVMFYHSLVSDWNHGNAHFLRGVATELIHRGHDVTVYEPKNGWSVRRLIEEHGSGPIQRFHEAYPELRSVRFSPRRLDLSSVLENADLVIVHEWNPPELIAAIGEHHTACSSFVLLFHDTHHRMVTQPEAMQAYNLRHYDGVLAYGEVLRALYSKRGWARRAWTWHEAADVRRFTPRPGGPPEADLVWIGNWGDDERTREIQEFIIGPVKSLGIRARVYGVRYPDAARQALAQAGIEYRGWLPNFEVPGVFARHVLTVHVPRGPYVTALPGIPTIRPFEALACGIPLICSPWKDAERLFSPGHDYLEAGDGGKMEQQITRLLENESLRAALARHGLETIRARHTCAQRVDELLSIVEEVRREPR